MTDVDEPIDDVAAVGAVTDAGRPTVDAITAALYAEHSVALMGMVRTLSRNDHDEAEAIVHEAFASCLERWTRRGLPDDPLAYLRRSTVNQTWAMQRRRARAGRFDRRSGPPTPSPGAEEVVAANTSEARLLDAVRTLPRRQRECVVVRYLLQASTAETATILAITEGSVKTHLSRALHTLRIDLTEPEDRP